MVAIDNDRVIQPQQVATKGKSALATRLFRVRLVGKRETYETRASSKADAIQTVAMAHNINADDLEAEGW